MLADRIAARDPGNAPASGDRIGFVYVKPATGQVASKLQGDRVETPQWIVEKGLKPDAEYYIEHQLMNPLSQLFGILLEQMPGYVRCAIKSEDHRESLASDILFRRALQRCNNTAAVAFLSKFGITQTPQALQPMKETSVRVEAPKKKQTMLDAFVRQTALMTDEMIVKSMKSAKKKMSEK